MTSWPMVPLGAVADFTTGSTPPTNVSDNFGGDVPWANISDLGPRTIYSTKKSLSRRGVEAGGFPRMTQPGDLMFSFKLSVGETSFAGIPMHTNEAIATFRAGQLLDLGFAYYVLPQFLLLAAQPNIYGAPLLNDSLMRRARIPLPPMVTQRRIADYLDRETGEIDAMLGKLDALAGVLEGRKHNEIRRWMASEGTSESRLKFAANVSLGKTFQGQQRNEDERFVNYVRAASIQRYGLELDQQRMWMSSDELDTYDLRRDDVLVVEGGAGYGRSVVLADDLEGWGFQNHVIRVRPMPGWDGRYINYAIKMHFQNGLIDILVDGATIPALSSEKARQLPIQQRPLSEQHRIADHLDEVTGRIDAMLAKVAQLKDLLIERRAALITAVVTGQKEVA